MLVAEQRYSGHSMVSRCHFTSSFRIARWPMAIDIHSPSKIPGRPLAMSRGGALFL